MKKLFAFILSATIVSFVATSCGPKIPTDDGYNDIVFANSEMGYSFNAYYDEETDDYALLEPGTAGIYYITLWNGDYEQDDYRELYLEFSSDWFDDYMYAFPASGTYSSGESYVKGTFNKSVSSYCVGEEEFEITDGSLILTRKGAGYSAKFEIVLDNGETLKGKLDGLAYIFEGDTEDVNVGLRDETFDYLHVAAYEDPEFPGVWQISFYGAFLDSDDDLELCLAVNTETGLTELPTGNFPMASEANAGIAGTAEPVTMTMGNNDIESDPGCWYVHMYSEGEGEDKHGWGNVLCAMPGEGYVNIAKTGEDYAIEFSYKTPNGNTVSGYYSGLIFQANEWRMRAPKETRPSHFPAKRR
jgi:hypothetical protein